MNLTSKLKVFNINKTFDKISNFATSHSNYPSDTPDFNLGGYLSYFI